MRYSQKWPIYAAEWDHMAIAPDRIHEFENYAHVAVAHKDVYQEIEARTGIPWYMAAVLHRRESDANFSTYLGNGQPLWRVTTIVPRGRGPFRGPNAFVDGAIDAVKIEGWGSVKDWRLEKVLYYCELFNGLGYEHHGVPSPYIWGATNIQRPGKYVADGVWNATAWDHQPGCAPLLATIARLDASVRFIRETPMLGMAESGAGDDYGTIKTVVEKSSALGSILHAPRLGAPKPRRRRQRR